MRQEELIPIFRQFNVPAGQISATYAFGSGHINDTYKVEMVHSEASAYVLQRINHAVFKDVDALMNNMTLVTKHLRLRSEQERSAGSASFKVDLALIPTADGRAYFQDDDGQYWRVMEYVAGAKSYDVVNTAEQARAGAWAFGKFHHLLRDLNPHDIQEVIPHFHHIATRLEKLESAVSVNSLHRAKHVEAELEYIRARQDRLQRILRMGAEGKIPTRITHNDTKFNNVLLNADDEALCVIDLDTVMPGYLAYDFGDAIRTVINCGREDEADLERIKLNIPLFEAYTEGYFAAAGEMITAHEAASLVDGVLLLPYMQAVRYLTDYLDGDHYFKTQHSSHNLQRTKAQLKLVKELEAVENQLVDIIYNYHKE